MMNEVNNVVELNNEVERDVRLFQLRGITLKGIDKGVGERVLDTIFTDNVDEAKSYLSAPNKKYMFLEVWDSASNEVIYTHPMLSHIRKGKKIDMSKYDAEKW